MEILKHTAQNIGERRALIPATIHPLKSTQFPMGFYTVQAANLVGFKGQPGHPGMAKLLEAVAAQLKRRPIAPAQRSPTRRPPMALIAAAAAFAVVLGGAGIWVASGGLHQLRTTIPEVVPSPPPPSAVEETLAALEGRWTRSGQSCAQGTMITREGYQLVFTAPDSTFQYEVGEVTDGGIVRTVVLGPEDFAGDVYSFTRTGDQLTVTLVKQPPEVNVWTRCVD
jgi:hypothetical protein